MSVLNLNISVALGGQQRANGGFPRGGRQNDQRDCHRRGEPPHLFFCSTAISQLFCKVGQAVGGARVRVEERGKDLVASSRGEFWRLLTPGLFSLVILVGQPLDRLVDYLVCILGRLV